jgi:hypothetical protein
MLANLQLDIDCDRETERIFSLLTCNDGKFQKMEGKHLCLPSPALVLGQGVKLHVV